MNPIRSSLRNPQVAYVLTFVILALGLHALFQMPRREDPKITLRKGLVLAVYPGATAEQVEEQVTKRVEERLFRFAEVKRAKTFSNSRPGSMVIRVELQDGVKAPDEFWSKLRHELNELAFLELPKGVLGPIVNSEFGDILAVLIAVQGERYGYRELLPYAQRVEDELRQMPAVSKIRRIGEQQEEIRITSTMERLAQYGITPFQIVAGLQSQNVVAEAGAFDAERSRVALRTTGLYESAEQVRRQIVGVSPNGQPIYIGDFARVQRTWADPDFVVRVNGTPSLLLSLEMHEGNNIVEFGAEIGAKLDQLRAELPPDLAVSLIVDQPRLVQQRISHFLGEFGTALFAVIIATMLLLPLPVAAIAATAIPVTIALTFLVLRALGIELHQVSLAGLIVALGMVVDDAIVIADNYVEMLDQGVVRGDAAWRSASDLAAPVMTSTFTIVATFLPMLFIPGTMGEFIAGLPITVSVALLCSSVVAMFLTPILCLLFIRRGLKEQMQTSARFKPLELMQRSYDRTIGYFMPRRTQAVALGFAAILAGLLLLSTVEERFFPPAERDQFAMNVRLPEGTRFAATDDAVRRIEAELGSDDEVVNYAVFVGGGAPRFFVSFDPSMPASNVAQIMVNTRSVEATSRAVARLRERLPRTVPEAEVVVDELQQGVPTESPIEVRLSGPDIRILRQLGEQVAAILRAAPNTQLVRDDFREDAGSLQVVINPEVANRLGMSSSLIANSLAGTFLGAPVSTLWEGSRAVNIVLRLDETHRESFDHIGSTYLVSAVSGARVPLREVASLEPVWQPSQIVRRNGVRTLTVGAHTEGNHLPSQVVKAILPELEALELPPGYRLTLGGEHETQKETFGKMVVALLISLFAIFMILLFTFRNVRDPLVIMVSIPLALFGAALGLVLTQNPFGFTAFLGVMALAGIVVRNGVILVEYMREQEALGVPTVQAAMDAGKRRLRPIFLTSASAAAGLLPMILSGSGLWSPLASVLAVGLLCSMVLTLIIVPVLYVMTTPAQPAPPAHALSRPVIPATAAAGALALALLLVGAPALTAQTPARLTAEQAMELAARQSHGVQAARAHVEETTRKRAGVASNYLPRLGTDVTLSRSSLMDQIRIPAGALGEVPDVGRFPEQDMQLGGGGATLLALTTITQPITHGFKIREGVAIARLEEQIAEARLRAVEGQVAVGALQAFAGLMIARAERAVAEMRVETTTGRSTHAQVASTAGLQLGVAAAQARVAGLDARQKLLAAENRVEDASHALSELLALPGGTRLELVAPGDIQPDATPLADWLRRAFEANPEILEARLRLAQAERGVSAARAEFIPEVGLLAMHIGQTGVPLLPRSSFSAGIRLQWTIWDFGARRQVVGERHALRRQAEANLAMVEGRVRGEVETAHRKLARAWDMVALAREAEQVRGEMARLLRSQAGAGLVLAVDEQEADTERAQGALERLQAELGYRIARAELMRLAGDIQF